MLKANWVAIGVAGTLVRVEIKVIPTETTTREIGRAEGATESIPDAELMGGILALTLLRDLEISDRALIGTQISERILQHGGLWRVRR